ncbi:hypothetical protein FEM48_Zijuj02G0135700 [Ziziphus jujuba var. spinosa]|uniref:Retrovirus-related Pol polyprotein from transposon TNT 1-94 n=1 Tax=Ziziphus jujuba var. spinosa TaxID=714518 RepID=A0A978VW05_ZIZJJ|nr:hypothetical protein FEM48_Zijuj02G0135700 [Ziziphus jujuba var. spinosa]
MKDLKANNYLFQAIDRSILKTILNKDTSKQIWDSIKKKYQGSARAKRVQLQALRVEFGNLQMKLGESVTEYFSRTMAIANKMRIHGEKLEDVTIDDEISSTVNTQMLSPKTFYGAYLIVKFAYRAYGLDTFPSEVSIQVGNIRSQGQVHLSRNERKKQLPKQLFGLNQVKASRTRMFQEEKEALFERKDGWVEIELGSFYNDGNDKEVNMSLKEVKSLHLKGGIIVEGIELRPKD